MIKHNPRLAAALIVISLAGCQGGSVATETAGNLPPTPTTVVGAADLHQLYDDKTWLWADGAGFLRRVEISARGQGPATRRAMRPASGG